MNTYTQIKASGALAQADVLSLRGQMGLSQLYQFEVLCEFQVPGQVDMSQLMGQAFTFTVNINNDDYHFNGLVSAASATAATRYVLIVEPGLALLRLTQHSRIFQNQTIPDIVKSVLSPYQLELKTSLSKTYAKEEYCVQYQESDLAFVLRLLEAAGIFYYFTQGQNQETLVLADQTSSYFNGVQDADFDSTTLGPALSSIVLSMNLCPAKFTLNSYDFTKSKQKLKVEQTKPIEKMQHTQYEFYQYQPDYQTTAEGEAELNILASSQNKQAILLEGASSYVDLLPGAKLNLTAQVAKSVNLNNWVISNLDFTFDTKTREMYTNHFKAIPASIVYQPPRMTPIPQAPSTQLAIVVGASNAEYNTDQYGRLQVEFFWDLNPKVTKQSVWLRSIAMWEGVLRVGTPVLVGFIDGNINDPVILGPIHQDTLMPINTLEGEQTKSVLVRRHPDASIQKTYNFLSFEDKKDAQLMHLNATKNMQVNVLQDFNQEVAKGTYHLKVKGNMTIETEGQLIVKSKGAMNFTTEDAFSLQAKSIEMKASQGLSASAQTVDVKAGASASIDGGGQMTLKAGIIQQN